MRQNLYGQEEVRAAREPTLTIGREPATGHDTMQMRVKLEVLSPTVKHGEETDLSSQVLGIGCDGRQGFGCCMEEDAINHFLVLKGDRGNLLWHREDDVKIRDFEQFGLAVLDPLRSGQRLALRAVSIPTAIETIPLMAALIAALEVATESCSPTHLDGGHDASLCRGHRRVMLFSIGFAVAAEDVRQFQLRPIHGPATQK